MHQRDIQIFAAIADYSSLRAAAESLGMSQPALTKTVRRLETELNVRLLERRARGVLLTEFGNVLRKHAMLFDQLKGDLLKEVADMKSGQSGTLRVGATPAVVETILIPALQTFYSSYNSARFAVRANLSQSLLNDLKDGHFDLVIALGLSDAHHDLSWHHLWDQHTYIVARSGHRLLKEPFTLKALGNEKWLLSHAEVNHRHRIKSLFADIGIDVSPLVFAETDNSPSALTALVRNTDLLTILTDDTIESTLGKGLSRLPKPAPVWTAPLRIYWRRSAYFPKLMQKFRDSLIAIAQEKTKLIKSRSS